MATFRDEYGRGDGQPPEFERLPDDAEDRRGTLDQLEALLDDGWQPPDLALEEFARQPPPPSFWEYDRWGPRGHVYTCRDCLCLADETYTVRFHIRLAAHRRWEFAGMWTEGLGGSCINLADLDPAQLGSLGEVVAALGWEL